MLWVLVEAILMSTHNIGLYEDLTNIIFELSSNTHLISSAVLQLHEARIQPSVAEQSSKVLQYEPCC